MRSTSRRATRRRAGTAEAADPATERWTGTWRSTGGPFGSEAMTKDRARRWRCPGLCGTWTDGALLRGAVGRLGTRRRQRLRGHGTSRLARRPGASIGGDVDRSRRACPAARSRLPVDRRLGLRWRCRHPGRPEGLRPLRRPRHDGDHGADRAEHGRGDAVAADRAGDGRRADRGRRRATSRRRREDRHGRRPRRRSTPSPRRSTRCRPRTPVVLDPVMVAESGARLLPGEAERALIELLLPRATVLTRTSRRRARSPAPVPPTSTARRSPRPSRRSAPTPSSSPAATATEATDVLFDRDAVHRDPGAAPPRRRRARLGLHALLGAGGPPRARLLARRLRPRRTGDRRRRRPLRPARPRRRRRAGQRPRRRLRRRPRRRQHRPPRRTRLNRALLPTRRAATRPAIGQAAAHVVAL